MAGATAKQTVQRASIEPEAYSQKTVGGHVAVGGNKYFCPLLDGHQTFVTNNPMVRYMSERGETKVGSGGTGRVEPELLTPPLLLCKKVADVYCV